MMAKVREQTQRSMICVGLGRFPARLSIPRFKNLRIETVEESQEVLDRPAPVIIQKPDQLRIRAGNSDKVVTQGGPCAYSRRSHNGGAVVQDESLYVRAMGFFFALYKVEPADFQNGRQE